MIKKLRVESGEWRSAAAYLFTVHPSLFTNFASHSSLRDESSRPGLKRGKV
jgi:hypothetical protein